MAKGVTAQALKVISLYIQWLVVPKKPNITGDAEGMVSVQTFRSSVHALYLPFPFDTSGSGMDSRVPLDSPSLACEFTHGAPWCPFPKADFWFGPSNLGDALITGASA